MTENTKSVQSVSTGDAYALSLMGLIPTKLRTEMYDKYFWNINISSETKQLIENKIIREDTTC